MLDRFLNTHLMLQVFTIMSNQASFFSLVESYIQSIHEEIMSKFIERPKIGKSYRTHPVAASVNKFMFEVKN